MKENTEIIQRISKPYIAEDCVQISIPYRNSLTIIDKNDILYHHLLNSDISINKYLEDERRIQFPYSNIPTYSSINGLQKYNYTNQIFNFEQPYIEIKDCKIIENYVVKDIDSALIIKKILSSKEQVQYMTRKEVEQLFESQNTDKEEFYIMSINTNDFIIVKLKTEDEIVSITKKGIFNQLQNYKKYGDNYLEEYSLRCLENLIKNMTIEDIPDNIPLDNESIVTIKTNGENIFIQRISVKFMKSDYYKVTILDIPVTKYTLEQIKKLSTEIKKVKEPKIPLILNPEVSKKDIKESKRLIKIRK